jgi:hypothetical protein
MKTQLEAKLKYIMLEEYTKNILHVMKESCNCMQQQQDNKKNQKPITKKDEDKTDKKNFNPEADITFKIDLENSGTDGEVVVIGTGLIVTNKETRLDYKVVQIAIDGIRVRPPIDGEEDFFIPEDVLKRDYYVK